MAYELIETVEVGSGGASSIEFTSIPQDGVDLVLFLSARNNRNEYADQLFVKLNSSGNFSRVNLRGYNNAVSSSSISSANILRTDVSLPGNLATSNTFSNGALYISNYTISSPKNISWDGVSGNNASEAGIIIQAGLWSNTDAVTSIQLIGNGDYVEHTTASLYKIS